MNDLFRKFSEFMAGRYGVDQLNKFLFKLTIVFIVISLFGFRIFSKLALALVLVYLFRMLSKNYNQRYHENQIYLKNSESIRWYWSEFKRKLEYRKTHKIVTCKKCGKKLSVPRGKGKIEISCPCGNKIRKKT